MIVRDIKFLVEFNTHCGETQVAAQLLTCQDAGMLIALILKAL